MAYSAPEDLLLGDIPLPDHLSASGMVAYAADEIDAQIGHIYVTPIEWKDPEDPKQRPSKLLLKAINNELASGRLMMATAAGSQDEETNAYGRYLINEAIKKLARIMDGRFELIDVDKIDDSDQTDNRPSIHNEDSESLVQGFYDSRVGSDNRYLAPRAYDNVSTPFPLSVDADPLP